MNACYIDSSVIVALLLEEKGHQSLSSLIHKTDSLYSSALLEAEVYATAVREQVTLAKAEEFISLVSLVIPQRSLKGEYHRIFSSGYCRGADAHHIATALYLDPQATSLTFLTADERQVKVARSVGLKLLEQ